MSTFVDLYTDLLNLGGQDATGDALVMAKNAINRAYRRTLSLSGQVSSQREFSITTVVNTSQGYIQARHLPVILSITTYWVCMV